MSHAFSIRIYYEDTDLGGIVYYANYLKFCERARSEIFFQNGLSPVEEDTHFIVKSLHADYHAPARFGDVIEVRTTPLEIKKASLTLEQLVYRQDEKLFSLRIDLVCLHDRKIARIPAHFLALFET